MRNRVTSLLYKNGQNPFTFFQRKEIDDLYFQSYHSIRRGKIDLSSEEDNDKKQSQNFQLVYFLSPVLVWVILVSGAALTCLPLREYEVLTEEMVSPFFSKRLRPIIKRFKNLGSLYCCLL